MTGGEMGGNGEAEGRQAWFLWVADHSRVWTEGKGTEEEEEMSQ